MKWYAEFPNASLLKFWMNCVLTGQGNVLLFDCELLRLSVTRFIRKTKRTNFDSQSTNTLCLKLIARLASDLRRFCIYLFLRKLFNLTGKFCESSLWRIGSRNSVNIFLKTCYLNICQNHLFV